MNNNNNSSSHSTASGSNSNSSHHHPPYYTSSSPSRRWVDKRRLSSSSQQSSSSNTNLLNNSTAPSSTTTTTSWNLSALLAAGPTDLLALAVRLDESRQDPAVLQVPLESGGRLQPSSSSSSSSADPEFVLALQYLRDQTKPPSSLRSSSSSSNNKNTNTKRSTHSFSFKNSIKGPKNPNSSTNDPSFYYALTPIILSGLLNAIQESKRQRHQQRLQPQTANNSTNNEVNDDDDTNDRLASELWLTCHTLRRAALQRIRARQRRQLWQRMAVPWIVGTVLMLWYRHSRAEWHHLLVERGYLLWHNNNMVDCDDTPAYAPACRLAEAHLWYRYRTIVAGSMPRATTTATTNGTTGWWDMLQPHLRAWWTTTMVLPGRAVTSSSAAAPLALHTHLQLPPLIELHELNNNRNPNSRRPTSHGKNHPKQGVPPVAAPDARNKYPLRWLGDTIVHQMVRNAMETYRPEHDPLSLSQSTRILDVGCGVGGTLYALLPAADTTTGNQQGQPSKNDSLSHPNADPSFSYHGIAISAAEIHLARQQAQYHLRDQPVYRHHYDAVTFRQQSFDQPFSGSTTPGYAHSNYTVAVAIESLSYSRNLEKTIRHIVDALEPGGILIVAEDVVLPPRHPSTDNVLVESNNVRPSLVPHSAWLAAFQSAQCRVVEQRDLSLQYELSTTPVDRTTMESPPPLHPTDALLAWGAVPVSMLPWEWGGDATSQRLLELHDERAPLQRLAQQRHRGVERAALAYHWYVCVKDDAAERAEQ